MEDDTPKGYHYEWVKDDAWRVGTHYAKCRQPHCLNPPVAELDRYSFALKKSRPYAYCADHLYGRRIVDGEIRWRRLVKDADSAAA